MPFLKCNWVNLGGGGAGVFEGEVFPHPPVDRNLYMYMYLTIPTLEIRLLLYAINTESYLSL